MPTSPYRVGLLAYDGCFASEVFGVVDLFTVANHVALAGSATRAPFEIVVLSPRRSVTASGGVRIGVAPVEDVDLLVVPGFELAPGLDLGARLATLDREVEVVRDAASRGRAVASICVGAFLLGEGGLLDGRDVTTAWLFASALAERYPTARVDDTALVLRDRGITTAAAFSAMFDLVVDVVRTRCSPSVARMTARITLVNDARTTQSPYVDEAALAASPRRFSDEVKQWLTSRAADPYDLGSLAAAFHVSTRTMLRRFHAETGESPLRHLQHVRVRRAKHLLETTDLGLHEIMNAVGYRDPGSFRRVFAERTGVSPADYRRDFRRPAPAAVR